MVEVMAQQREKLSPPGRQSTLGRANEESCSLLRLVAAGYGCKPHPEDRQRTREGCCFAEGTPAASNVLGMHCHPCRFHRTARKRVRHQYRHADLTTAALLQRSMERVVIVSW